MKEIKGKLKKKTKTDFILRHVCPNGYIQMDGDYPGNGLGQYSATLEKCTYDCSINMKCKAFEYSKKSSSCKILPKDTPINIQHKDFIFCKKEGKSYLL